MASVLVTGGAGFIGSNLCNRLSARGYTAIAFDDLSLGWQNNLDHDIQFIHGDTGNPADLQKAGNPEYIVHLAGSSSAPMFIESFHGSMINSIGGFLNVLEYAAAAGVKKIIFASTSSVYGNLPFPHEEHGRVRPENYYAVSKWSMEEISRIFAWENELPIISLRFMSIYGPNEEHKGRLANLVSQFIWGIEEGKQPVIFGDGRQSRDFTSVEDVINAIERAIQLESGVGLEVFNVGTGQQTTLNELVAILGNVTNFPINPVFIPNPVENSYIRAQCADLARSKDLLKFEAKISLEDGIRQLLTHRTGKGSRPASLSF